MPCASYLVRSHGLLLRLQTVGDSFWIVVILDYFVTEVFPFAGAFSPARVLVLVCTAARN